MEHLGEKVNMLDTEGPHRPEEETEEPGASILEEDRREGGFDEPFTTATDDDSKHFESAGTGNSPVGAESLEDADTETFRKGLDDDNEENLAGANAEAPDEIAPGTGDYAGRDYRKTGRDSYESGRDLRIYYGATVEEAKFKRIPSDVLRRAHDIFVEPPGYRETLEAIEGAEARQVGGGTSPEAIHSHFHWVILVHGADHSGRWTSALNLAREIAASRCRMLETPPTVYQYARPTRSEISLAEAIASGDLPEQTVILVKDCFERNIHREELETGEIENILSSLAKNRSVLVLTGLLPLNHREDLAVVKLHAQLPDLRKVLRTHLSYGIHHEGLPLREDQVDSLGAALLASPPASSRNAVPHPTVLCEAGPNALQSPRAAFRRKELGPYRKIGRGCRGPDGSKLVRGLAPEREAHGADGLSLRWR